MCRVQQDASTHIEQDWDEPHYKKELQEVDYEFSTHITLDDIEDYFGIAINDELYVFLDIDMLELDSSFIEFMTDKYYETAQAECVEKCSE